MTGIAKGYIRMNIGGSNEKENFGGQEARQGQPGQETSQGKQQPCHTPTAAGQTPNTGMVQKARMFQQDTKSNTSEEDNIKKVNYHNASKHNGQGN